MIVATLTNRELLIFALAAVLVLVARPYVDDRLAFVALVVLVVLFILAL